MIVHDRAERGRRRRSLRSLAAQLVLGALLVGTATVSGPGLQANAQEPVSTASVVGAFVFKQVTNLAVGFLKDKLKDYFKETSSNTSSATLDPHGSIDVARTFSGSTRTCRWTVKTCRAKLFNRRVILSYPNPRPTLRRRRKERLSTSPRRSICSRRAPQQARTAAR